MRGIAVLAAAAAAWVIAGGHLPSLTIQRPRWGLHAIIGACAAGASAFVISLGLLGTLIPAGAFAILGATIPLQVSSVRRRRTRELDAATWPDLLAHVRSSVAAGMTLPDAYVDAAERVGGPHAETLDEVRRHLLYGGGFSESMDVVRSHADDATADRVAMTLVIANDTGGQRVGEVLAALSASIAGEFRLRQAHEAALTEQRWTAGVALAAPWAILALSIATNPQAADSFRTVEGGIVVGIGLVCTSAGWIFSHRVAALAHAPRVFR